MTERDFCCREKTSFSSLKNFFFPKGLFQPLFLRSPRQLVFLPNIGNNFVSKMNRSVEVLLRGMEAAFEKKKINPSLKTVLLTRWKDFGGRKTAGALIFSFSVITFKFALYVSSSMTLFAKKFTQFSF
jgi:hypothetical protein